MKERILVKDSEAWDWEHCTTHEKRRKKISIRFLIVVAVCGEGICLYHFGYLHHEYVGSFLILSAWLKDGVREFVQG